MGQVYLIPALDLIDAGMPPVNTVAPVVSGTTVVGQVLSCTTGTWTGDPTITYSYQWKRGTTNIGTNSNTYTLVSADISSNISCVVTATNAEDSVSQASNSVGPITSTAPPVTSGLQAYYDGRNGFTESSGFVTQWDDLSGNDHHITISATNKPIWNQTDALLMVPNLAAGTVNLPNTVSINSRSFTLFIVSDGHSSRTGAGGAPVVGAVGAMAYYSGVGSLTGISCDTTSQKAIRAFINTLSGTQSISSGHHQGWSVVGQAGSASRSRFFAGGTITSSGTPFTSNSQSGLNIGGTSWNTKLVGRIRCILLYNRDLTDQETTDVLDYLADEFGAKTKTLNIAVDGDSLSYGTGEEDTTADNYIRQFPAAIYDVARIYNFAVPSQNVLHMVSGQSAVTGVYDSGATRNILFVFNADITHGMEQDTYCSDMVAAGFEVFRGTPIAGNFGGGYDAARLIERTRILGTSITGVTVVDLGGQAALSNYNDSTYYQTDKIHLKPAANTIIKNLFYEAAFP